MSTRRPPVILAALREEIRPLMRSLDVVGSRRLPGSIVEAAETGIPTGPAERTDLAELRWVRRGKLSGAPVVVAVTGDGERRASAGISALLRAIRPSRLLVLGVGGALTPDLRTGELVIGAEVQGPGGECFVPAAAEVAMAASALGAPEVLLVTRPELVPNPAAKEVLRRQVVRGLPPNRPMVVDQESAAYAAAAQAAGIPWLIVRAISDEAGEGLPSYLASCLDREGAVRRAAVAWNTALRPWRVPAVVRLARRVQVASRALTRVGESWLKGWSELDPREPEAGVVAGRQIGIPGGDRSARGARALDEPALSAESPRFRRHRSMSRERARGEIRPWR